MLRRMNFIVIVIAIIIASCVEDESTLGLQFIDDTSFELISWDTLTIKMSTVLLDSFPTSNNTFRLLVGSYDDPDFGLVNASSYFKITSSITDVNFNQDLYKYEYAAIKLKYDRYSFNDTTQYQTFYVYEIAKEMEPEDDIFYNTSELEIKYENGVDSSLGEFTFLPRPNSEDSIEIRLVDRIGEEVFNTYFNNQSGDDVNFVDIIEGFNLRGDINNSAVLGFLPNAEFVVYYTDFSEIPSAEKVLKFTLQDRLNHHFINIEKDQQNVVLQSLIESGGNLLSAESDNQAYLMAGVGLALRVELPHIRKILEDNPNLIINEVTMSLKPIIEKYNAPKQLPEILGATIVDKNNKTISDLLITATLEEDDEFDRNTEYLFNIKDFVELQLSLEEDNTNALLITPHLNSFQTSVDNLIVGDSDHDQYETKIMLNLIQIENE